MSKAGRSYYRDVPGFKGKYAATRDGDIWSYETNRFLKPEPVSNTGYLKVNLGKGNTQNIHDIVAQCFLERPEGKDIVNHINHNRQDNRARNLEWVNASQNKKLQYEHDKGVIPKKKEEAIPILKRQGYTVFQISQKLGLSPKEVMCYEEPKG